MYMNIDDVVMIYEIQNFIDIVKDKKLGHENFLNKITHLYFTKQSPLITPDDLPFLYTGLEACTALSSINLKGCEFTDWYALLRSLVHLKKLTINIRECANITARDIKAALPHAYIIDDEMPLYALPPACGMLIDNIYTEYELKELLLLGFTMHMNSLQVNNKRDDKISRKWFEIQYSIAFTEDHVPFVLLTSSFTEDIQSVLEKKEKKVQIKYALCFAANDINTLKIKFVKIRPPKHRDPENIKNKKFANSELSALRFTQTAYIADRQDKFYVLQDFVFGESLDQQTKMFYESGLYPPQVDFAQVSSVVIEANCFFAQGVIHGDFKPKNIIWRKDQQVSKLIDLESVTNCNPTETISPDIYFSKRYKPPKSGLLANRITESYALALTLQQLIVIRPYVTGFDAYVEACESDFYYNALREYYAQELEKKCHVDLAEAINGLLITDGAYFTSQTKTLADVTKALSTHYPDQYQEALNARYRYIVQEISNIYVKYANVKTWLDTNLKKQEECPLAENLISALNASTPKNIGLTDILYVQTIQHFIQVFVCYNGDPAVNIIEQCNYAMHELYALDDLTIDNLYPIYRKAHKLINDFYNFKNNIISQLRMLPLELSEDQNPDNPQDSDLDQDINNCLLLHKNVVGLFLGGKAIQDILRFAINRLEEIYDSSTDYAQIAMQDLTKVFHGQLEAIGDSINSDLAIPANPILNQFSFRTIKNPQEILFAAIHAKDYLTIQRCLDRNVNPFNKHDNRTALDHAIQYIADPGCVDIIPMLLTKIQSKDLIYVLRVARIILASITNVNDTLNFVQEPLAAENRKKVALSLYQAAIKVMSKYENDALDSLKMTIMTFLQNNYQTAIMLICAAGFDPLESLTKDRAELFNVRDVPTCNLLSCFEDTPYKHFSFCKPSLMTYYMHTRNFQAVSELLMHANNTQLILDEAQLGYHLVVAASEGEKELAQELVKAGASTYKTYPDKGSRHYRNKTAEEIAQEKGFSIFTVDNAVVQNSRPAQVFL